MLQSPDPIMFPELGLQPRNLVVSVGVAGSMSQEGATCSINILLATALSNVFTVEIPLNPNFSSSSQYRTKQLLKKMAGT